MDDEAKRRQKGAAASTSGARASRKRLRSLHLRRSVRVLVSTIRAVFHAPRLIGSHRRALPDFIIIGAQKCGTTSLYSYLCRHPQVIPAAVKEVHFFDHAYSKGANWYRSFFPLRSHMTAGRITGEASPYYLYHPLVPLRIKELVPDVRLIALFRDPVGRAISHYFHSVRLGTEHLPIEEALDEEHSRLSAETERMKRDPHVVSFAGRHHSYLSRGLYADQLERYLAVFPKHQILTMQSERFFAHPRSSLSQVLAFLGVDSGIEIDNVKPRNVGNYTHKVEDSLVRRLSGFYAPHNQRLYELLGNHWDWGDRCS